MENSGVGSSGLGEGVFKWEAARRVSADASVEVRGRFATMALARASIEPAHVRKCGDDQLLGVAGGRIKRFRDFNGRLALEVMEPEHLPLFRHESGEERTDQETAVKCLDVRCVRRIESLVNVLRLDQRGARADAPVVAARVTDGGDQPRLGFFDFGGCREERQQRILNDRVAVFFRNVEFAACDPQQQRPVRRVHRRNVIRRGRCPGRLY